VIVDHDYEPHIALIRDEPPPRKKRHKPRRRVVERTLAWLFKCRAILVRSDKKAANHLGLLKLVSYGPDWTTHPGSPRLCRLGGRRTFHQQSPGGRANLSRAGNLRGRSGVRADATETARPFARCGDGFQP